MKNIIFIMEMNPNNNVVKKSRGLLKNKKLAVLNIPYNDDVTD